MRKTEMIEWNQVPPGFEHISLRTCTRYVQSADVRFRTPLLNRANKQTRRKQIARRERRRKKLPQINFLAHSRVLKSMQQRPKSNSICTLHFIWSQTIYWLSVDTADCVRKCVSDALRKKSRKKKQISSSRLEKSHNYDNLINDSTAFFVTRQLNFDVLPLARSLADSLESFFLHFTSSRQIDVEWRLEDLKLTLSSFFFFLHISFDCESVWVRARCWCASTSSHFTNRSDRWNKNKYWMCRSFVFFFLRSFGFIFIVWTLNICWMLT